MINFAVLLFKLRLIDKASEHWAYRIVVCAILAIIAPGPGAALMILAAVLRYGLPD